MWNSRDIRYVDTSGCGTATGPRPQHHTRRSAEPAGGKDAAGSQPGSIYEGLATFKENPTVFPGQGGGLKMRPVFIGNCSQCPSFGQESLVDSNSEILCLEDLLQNPWSFCLEKNKPPNRCDDAKLSVRLVRWLLTRLLGLSLKKVIYHPGQLEIVKLAGDVGGSILFITSHASPLSLLTISLTLIQGARRLITYIQVDTEVYNSLDWSTRHMLECAGLKIQVISFECVPGSVGRTRGDGNILLVAPPNRKQNLRQYLRQLWKSEGKNEVSLVCVSVSDAVPGGGRERIRLDFSQPIALSIFSKFHMFKPDIPEELLSHIHHIRSRMPRITVGQCLGFLESFPQILTPEPGEIVEEDSDEATEEDNMRRIQVNCLDTLREIITSRGLDLAFSGSSSSVVDETNLVSTELFPVAVAFLPEAVLATSILSLLSGPASLLSGQDGLRVSRERSIERAELLFRLLDVQEMCQTSCESIHALIGTAIYRLESLNCFLEVQHDSFSRGGVCSRVKRRCTPKTRAGNDSDEEWEKVDTNVVVSASPEAARKLHSLAQLLRCEILVLYCVCLELSASLLPSATQTAGSSPPAQTAGSSPPTQTTGSSPAVQTADSFVQAVCSRYSATFLQTGGKALAKKQLSGDPGVSVWRFVDMLHKAGVVEYSCGAGGQVMLAVVAGCNLSHLTLTVTEFLL